jgi:Uma2 family endonuclease
MRFFEGAPAFVAEVRSENNYGPTAGGRLKEKRRDYFAAGTLIIWDVDLLSEDVVRVYRAGDPEPPIIYRHGKIAENACGRSVSVSLAAPGRTRRES